ncbi:MAG: asparagine synthase-related protein [Nitriliruptoraceae bacterium]
MSIHGIVGVIYLDAGRVDVGLLPAMAHQAQHRGADPGVWHADGAALGHQSPGMAGLQPVERDGLVCVADVRLDGRATLRQRLLARGFEVADDADDAALVLGAYRCWGLACTEHLYGDYAVAIWEQRRRRLLLARDPMGMRALYLRLEPRRRVVFATELKQLLVVPGVPVAIDELSIAANLAGPYLPPDRTLYAGIDQLPAGHAMVVDVDGARSWRHWRPEPGDHQHLTDDEAADAYRERLTVAVQDRLELEMTAPAGISLSGGLDSVNLASVAGWLQQHGRAATPALHAYAWRFDEVEGADERSISDLVVAAFPIVGHTVPGDDCWPLSDAERAAPDRDDPFRWPYQALTDRTHAQARADGVGLLLTGARGDEVTGDWAFDELGLLRSGHVRAAWQDLRLAGEAKATGPLGAATRTAGAELLHRWPELARRRSAWQHRGARPAVAPWVPERLRQRTDLDEVISASRTLPDFGGLGRSTRFARVTSPQTARLAVHAERTLARAGMVAADPYADRRLAELVLGLPAWQVQRRGARKRLARRALAGIVPEAARVGAAKTIPSQLYDRGLRERASATVDTLLTEPVAAAHGWLDTEAVRAAHDRYRRTGRVTHDYWWVLTTELWLRRWWT